MFFDIMFEIGGQALVDATSDIIAPIFEWVCDMAATSWWWDCIATGMEAILS